MREKNGSKQLSHALQKPLAQELKCYQQLFELSKQQLRAIGSPKKTATKSYAEHSPDLDALQHILDQKTEIINQIVHLENIIQPIHRKLVELQEELTEPVRQLVDEISVVLKQITALEAKAEKLLTQQFQEVKKELGDVKQTGKVVKIYSSEIIYRPRYIDKEK